MLTVSASDKLILWLLLGCLASGWNNKYGATAQPVLQVIPPSADSTVGVGSRRSTLFGNWNNLLLRSTRSGWRQRFQVFMKFPLPSDVDGAKLVHSAKLRLYLENRLRRETRIDTHPVTVDWHEATINGRNYPLPESLPRTITYIPAGHRRRWVEIDITDAVKVARASGQSFVSVALVEMSGSGNVYFTSKERGGNIPSLELLEEDLTLGGVTVDPTSSPTNSPAETPSKQPTATPVASPTSSPSSSPTTKPSSGPTASPTSIPTASPTTVPSLVPTSSPSASPTMLPTASPTSSPTSSPSSSSPTSSPTGSPTIHPSTSPTALPSSSPTEGPSIPPTASPTRSPTASPTQAPSRSPTLTDSPTSSPTTSSPTFSEVPTHLPTASPTASPSSHPTASPTTQPSSTPTASPTASPTMSPTSSPSSVPTASPSTIPTSSPTSSPSGLPTARPSGSPTELPTASPTILPTASPSSLPTASPTSVPTASPTKSPSGHPTASPTLYPTSTPTASPSGLPTASPTQGPSANPTGFPTNAPSTAPTVDPYYSQTESTLVSRGSDGRLLYEGYENQVGAMNPGGVQGGATNTVPDFSTAGYMEGDVPIPFVPVAEVNGQQVILHPSNDGTDDTARIQAAIDSVGTTATLGADGFRGAVLLKAGTYYVDAAGGLLVPYSGVVIRGEGSGVTAGTTIIYRYRDTENTYRDLTYLFTFGTTWGGGNVYLEEDGDGTLIDQEHVPVGATSVKVSDASGFNVGDEVAIQCHFNDDWIVHMSNMSQWGWTSEEYDDLYWRRIITAKNGDELTFDAPIVQPIESQYGGGTVKNFRFPGKVDHVGIENMRLVSAPDETEVNGDGIKVDEDHGQYAIKLVRVEDAWVRQVSGEKFWRGLVSVVSHSSYVTIEDCSMTNPISHVSGGRRYAFNVDDSEYILMQRCFSSEGRHDFVTGSRTNGPTVFVDSLSLDLYDDNGPHHRYSTGLLFDSMKATRAGAPSWDALGHFNVQNRKGSGSGHGWSGAQVMFWNLEGKIICDAPNGAMNWAVGCIGDIVDGEGSRSPEEPPGIYQSHGKHISDIRSLFYSQLYDRKGTNSEAYHAAFLPQQKNGFIWDELQAWGGDGLFLDPLVAWFDEDALPLTFTDVGGGQLLSSALKIGGIIRDLNLLGLEEGYTATWSLQSGPSTASFSPTSTLVTSVQFGGGGTHVLELLVESSPLSDISFSYSAVLQIEMDMLPTSAPTSSPTSVPSASPTYMPSSRPTSFPSSIPTASPTQAPSRSPSLTDHPTITPTASPSSFPTALPTAAPTASPTARPSGHPTESPTSFPTSAPTASPSSLPTSSPTKSPSSYPTASSTNAPSSTPTVDPYYSQSESTLVSTGLDGRLLYEGYENQVGATNPSGYVQGGASNTVPDFSTAGYMEGDVHIPFVPAKVILNPNNDGSDDTARIQAAINSMADLTPDGDGFRGAVLLKAGTYYVDNAGGITVEHSGVVIRGEGSGVTGGTTIIYRYRDTENNFRDSTYLFTLGTNWGGGRVYLEEDGDETMIDQQFVPVGATKLKVDDASGFNVGDEIAIQCLFNDAWLAHMSNMSQWSWTPESFDDELFWRRIITAKNGNELTLDASIVQPIESQYGGGMVKNFRFTGKRTKIGIENMRLMSAPDETILNGAGLKVDEDHAKFGIKLTRVEDGWVRQVAGEKFWGGLVEVIGHSSYVTVEDCSMTNPISHVASGRRYAFSIDDSEFVLVQRCFSSQGRHDFVTGSRTMGPTVFVDNFSQDLVDDNGPHLWYSTGILLDSMKALKAKPVDGIWVQMGDGHFNVQNRGGNPATGQGHGWSGAQVMFWNLEGKFICDAPNGAMNWAVGCIGDIVDGEGSRSPEEAPGIYQSQGKHVADIRSLFYSQLHDRKGTNSEAYHAAFLPQQKSGFIWDELQAWGGDGLFLDPLVTWFDEDALPLTFTDVGGGLLSSALKIGGIIRDLNLLGLEEGCTVTWSLQSGPSTVTFSSTSSLITSVQFGGGGTHVLGLLVESSPLSDVSYSYSAVLQIDLQV